MSQALSGKYETVRRIAQGGMGKVFLARQKGMAGFDRLVILKTLKEALAKEQGFIDQFLDEARVAATLNHPNIVSIYEVGQNDGVYFIAMEFIAGVDLAKLWILAAKNKIGLPFQVSVQIAHDAALGLAHAHAAVDMGGKALQIVHRDISPQNIMVRGDGVTKVVDFGIAKAQNRITQTAVGTVKGKLQYMSPEQVRGEPLSGKSDQFALGVVLWEMCTGKRLFKAKTEIDTLNRILQEPIPPLSSLVPSFPPVLEKVILRMLERDQGNRFPTLREAADALREYLEMEHAGQSNVAQLVQEVCGEELGRVTEDLTPKLTQDRRAYKHDDTVLYSEPSTSLEEKESVSDVSVLQSIRVLSSGAQARLETEDDVEQWVLDGKLTREDKISFDGEGWVRLGDVPHLVPVFGVADRRRAKAFAAEQAAHHKELPTVTGENTSMPHALLGASSVAPVVLSESMILERSPVDGLSSLDALSPVAPFPQATPTTDLAFAGFDDEYSPLPLGMQTDPGLRPYEHPQRKTNSALLILFGVLFALVATFALLYKFAPDAVEKMVHGIFPSNEKFELPAALYLDDEKALLAAIENLAKSIDADRPGINQAKAAMLHASLSAMQSEQARLWENVSGKTSLQSAKRARIQATHHRVEAYKAATESRSHAPGLPTATLAMATYQATRGTLSEMAADLKAISPKVGLEDEKKMVSLSARVLSSIAIGEQKPGLVVEVEALRQAHPNDERLRYFLVALLVESLVEGGGSKAEFDRAMEELKRGLLVHEGDTRYGLLLKKLKPISKKIRKRTPKRQINLEAERKKAEESANHKDKHQDEKRKKSDEKDEKETFKSLFSSAKQAQKRGAPYRAAKLFRQALAKKKNSSEARLALAWCYLDMGKNRSAMTQFEKVLDAAPTKTEAVFGIAEALRYDGQKAAALRAYKKYLSLAPTGADAKVAKRAIQALQ